MHTTPLYRPHKKETSVLGPLKMELYLVEEHVADGEDGFDAGKERLVLLFADGAEFTQRTRVDVVDAA